MYNSFLRAVVITAALLTLYGAAPNSAAMAAPYAEIVMDARTGQVVRSRSADAKLHPASLTKMMTLYVAFQAVERGEISLDQKVLISRNAAAEPRSKLYLKAGSRVAIRYLIRAAAIKSANDAATALGEAISGSEQAFAQRMTRTARELGMHSTTFKNAHGLTASGHKSTARDMAVLVRHLMYDYPEYWNIFGRVKTDAGIKTVTNTNHKLLQSYRGADGVKTGYTSAAGNNLAGSALRGNERVIAVIFGAKSSASRYRRMVQLLDMGFERVPTYAKVIKPVKPRSTPAEMLRVALAPKRGGAPVEQDSRFVQFAGSIVPSANASTGPVFGDGSRGAPVQIARAAPRPGSAVSAPSGATLADLLKLAGQQQGKSTAAPLRMARAAPRGGYDRQWAIDLGAYKQQAYAENLLNTLAPLSSAATQVAATERAGLRLYQARIVGLSEAEADNLCSKLRAQDKVCRPMPPKS